LAQALLTKANKQKLLDLRICQVTEKAETMGGHNCCCTDAKDEEVVSYALPMPRLDEFPEELIMRHVCCSDGDLLGETDEIRPRPAPKAEGADMAPFWKWSGETAPKKCEVWAESLEALKRRLISIAGAEMELRNSEQAKAYADVLDRVLDALVSSMQAPAQIKTCDLADKSVLMIVVAPQDELQELVSTPQALVLTQEPGATSVHDDRFKTLLSKLCRSHLSLSGTCRRESSARHIAVSNISGEILATSAIFVSRSREPFSLLSPRSPEKHWAADQSAPLSALEVARVLTHGVVFAAFERGGLVVMPSVDVARGRAYRLTPIMNNNANVPRCGTTNIFPKTL